MTSVIILAKENRIMIEAIKEDITNLAENITSLGLKVDEAFNHMSGRLPGWATITITILGSLVTGLVVSAVRL